MWQLRAATPGGLVTDGGYAIDGMGPGVVAPGRVNGGGAGARTSYGNRLRVALDNGEVVELDGGTLMPGGEESPSMLLRLAPWRARSVARVLEEWSAVSWVFHRAPRPILTEPEPSRTLDLAASALGDTEPTMPVLRGDRVVPSRQRLDAVAVLAERESRLSALQRLALVDTTAPWLSEPNGGEQLAHCTSGSSVHNRGHHGACVSGADHDPGQLG